MSFRVVAKVLDHSEETLARRLILLALAEAAHDDGISWLDQETIARKARLSRTHVAERLREMEQESVLELRKAQRGRRRISVYRLSSLPGLDEPNYDRLPFSLNQPFATVSELPTPSADDGVGSSVVTVSDPPSLALALVHEPSLEPPIAAATSSQALVGAFVDESRARGVDPPKRVVGAMARNVKLLLDEGRSAEEVEAGIRHMLDRGLANPSLLAQCVVEAQLAARPRARQAPTSLRYGRGVTSAQILARADRLEAERIAAEERRSSA